MDKRTERFTIFFEPENADRVNRAAKDEHLRAHHLLYRIVMQWLDRHEPDKKEPGR